MKCNINECKKIIDGIVFNDPEVKELVEMGWVEPESEIKYDYVVKGQTVIIYRYKFFGGDYISHVDLLNSDNSEYLFGWSGEDALTKAANRAIREIVHHCSLKYEKEYNDAIYDIYSEPYSNREYNGD